MSRLDAIIRLGYELFTPLTWFRKIAEHSPALAFQRHVAAMSGRCNAIEVVWPHRRPVSCQDNEDVIDST